MARSPKRMMMVSCCGDGGFLRAQKMVAPTYQELTADQVLGFGEYYSLRDDPGNGMAMTCQRSKQSQNF